MEVSEGGGEVEETEEPAQLYHHSSVSRAVKVLEELDETCLDSPQVCDLVKEVYAEVLETIYPSFEEIERYKKLRIKRRPGMVDSEDTGSSNTNLQRLREIYGDQLDTSRITERERQIIKKNWFTFTKRYGYNNPLVFMNFKHTSRKFLGCKNLQRFKMFLSYGLPGRSIYKVYRTWQMMFCTALKHRFTVGETRLLKLLDEFSTDNADDRFRRLNILSIALQRTRKRIKTKLRELEAPVQPEKVKWTMGVEQELVRTVVQVSGSRSLEDLQETHGRYIWGQVQRQFNQGRHKLSDLYKHWHHHLAPALFSTAWRRRLDVQTDLILRLERQLSRGQLSDWAQVDWHRLARKVGNYGSVFVNKLVLDLCYNIVQKDLRGNITESVKIMCKHLLDKHEILGDRLPRLPPQSTSGKYLRRLEYDFDMEALYEIPPP